MKYCRNKGLPSLPCLHSDISSGQTRTAVEVQLSPVGQSGQPAESSTEPLYSEITVTNQRGRRVSDQPAGSSSEPLYSQITKANRSGRGDAQEDAGDDVVYSDLVLNDEKNKRKKKKTTTKSNDEEVVYSTVRSGFREEQ
ncbi:hypothetical protein MATL_G00002340 [Megalops atlanticus]|uniref:Uncharacterized protein n=1 Tax=Megalops atlanticus TaxID=7932 RepID=A0A9D3TGX3_MEGAT|nr:hypothetical protein MATL_G00002340 [Megalops atlanticus]